MKSGETGDKRRGPRAPKPMAPGIMRRPRKAGEFSAPISIYVPRSLRDEIDVEAAATGRSKSALIADLCREALAARAKRKG